MLPASNSAAAGSESVPVVFQLKVGHSPMEMRKPVAPPVPAVVSPPRKPLALIISKYCF